MTKGSGQFCVREQARTEVQQRLPIRSVAELREFPFQSFAEIGEALDAGVALVWVRYDFWTVWRISDVPERLLHLILIGSAGWCSILVTLGAVVSQDPWLMLGIPAALLGLVLATPNPTLFHGCMPFALLLIGFVGSVLTGRAFFFPGAAAIVTWFLTCAGLGTADLQIRQEMVDSEAAFIRLYSRGIVTNVTHRQPNTGADNSST